MKTRDSFYFATDHEGPGLISGARLPKPGAYHFMNCTFHCRLAAQLEAHYQGSEYTNCDMPGNPERFNKIVEGLSP